MRILQKDSFRSFRGAWDQSCGIAAAANGHLRVLLELAPEDGHHRDMFNRSLLDFGGERACSETHLESHSQGVALGWQNATARVLSAFGKLAGNRIDVRNAATLSMEEFMRDYYTARDRF